MREKIAVKYGADRLLPGYVAELDFRRDRPVSLEEKVARGRSHGRQDVSVSRAEVGRPPGRKTSPVIPESLPKKKRKRDGREYWPVQLSMMVDEGFASGYRAGVKEAREESVGGPGPVDQAALMCYLARKKKKGGR